MGLLTTQSVFAVHAKRIPDAYLALPAQWRANIKFDAEAGHLAMVWPDGVQDEQLRCVIAALSGAGLRRLVLRHALCQQATLVALMQGLEASWPKLECIDLRGTAIDTLTSWQLSNLSLYHGVDLQMDVQTKRLVSHPDLSAQHDGLQLWQRRAQGAKQGAWVQAMDAFEIHQSHMSVDDFIAHMQTIKDHAIQVTQAVWSGGVPWTIGHITAVMAWLSGQKNIQHVVLDGLALGVLFAKSHDAYLMLSELCDQIAGMSLQSLSMQNNQWNMDHVHDLAYLGHCIDAVDLQGNSPEFLNKLAMIEPLIEHEGGRHGWRAMAQSHDIKDDAMKTNNEAVFKAKMQHMATKKLDHAEKGVAKQLLLDFRTYLSDQDKSALRYQGLLADTCQLSLAQCDHLMAEVAKQTLSHKDYQKALFQLYLSHAGLSDAHLKQIAYVLRANAHVHALDLSYNPSIGMAGLLQIARALQANTHINILGLAGHDCFKHAPKSDVESFVLGIGDCSGLTHIDLSDCAFGREALKLLVQGVLCHGHISSLNLSNIVCGPGRSSLGRQEIESLLVDIMRDNPGAMLSSLKRVAVANGHGFIDIDAMKRTIEGAKQDGLQSLAPLTELLRHFPVRVNNDILFALRQVRLQMPAGVKLSKVVDDMGVGLWVLDAFNGHAEQMPPLLDAKTQAKYLADFCYAVARSAHELFNCELTLANMEQPFGMDHYIWLQHQKDRVVAVLNQVQGLLQLPALLAQNGTLQCDRLCTWACHVMHLEQLKASSISKYLGVHQSTHLAFGVTVVSLIAEDMPLAKQRSLDAAVPTASAYQYPVSRSPVPLTAPQYQHLLGFKSQPEMSQHQQALRKCFAVAAIVAASAAVFALLYFAAPVMVVGMPWLLGLSQVAQAAVCWAMVMGVAMLVGGLVAGYRAQRAATSNKASAVGAMAPSDPLHVLPGATKQSSWRFFNGQSLTQDPSHSPEKPDRSHRNHMWLPAAKAAGEALEDDGKCLRETPSPALVL